MIRKNSTTLADHVIMNASVTCFAPYMGHAMDPEKVNRDAFADQKMLIEKLGGVEALMAMKSFGHTPVG